MNATYDPRDHCDYVDLFRTQGPESRSLLPFYTCPNRIWFKDMICTTLTSTLQQSSLSEDGNEQENASALLVDTLRFNEPDCEAKYSCWNTRIGARASNHGTRIDYILLDKLTVKRWFSLHGGKESLVPPFECVIRADVFGSDHCPVTCSFVDSFFDSAKLLEAASESLTHITKKQHVSTRLDQYFSPIRKSSETDKSSPDNRSPPSLTPPRHAGPLKRKTLESFFTPSGPVDPLQQLAAEPAAADARLSPVGLTVKNALDPQWQQVFHGSKKPVPVCTAHGEPCVLLTVTKKGRNQGRKFYSCSRPVGASTDPAARCKFFKWTR